MRPWLQDQWGSSSMRLHKSAYQLHYTKMIRSTFEVNILTSNHREMNGKTKECNAAVPLLCSLLLLLSFSVASTKPAPLHGLCWLPGSHWRVLLVARGRYDFTRATISLIWPQGGGQAEDGVLGPGDAAGRKLRSGPACKAPRRRIYFVNVLL